MPTLFQSFKVTVIWSIAESKPLELLKGLLEMRVRQQVSVSARVQWMITLKMADQGAV